MATLVRSDTLHPVQINPRVKGTEAECVMVSGVPGEDGQQAMYRPRLEDLSRAIVHEVFGVERPTRGGFTSGGRVYPDHSFIEFSTRERTSALQTIRDQRYGEAYVRAVGKGFLQLAEAGLKAGNSEGEFKPIRAVLGRTLGVHGATCGWHHNQLGMRSIELSDQHEKQGLGYGAVLCSYLVTRSPWASAGGVRFDPLADKLELVGAAKLCDMAKVYGSVTTSDKAIVNTRDTPYADRDIYRRVHITSGDGNLWPLPEFLKLTSTSLVMRLIENGVNCDDIMLANPLKAARDCALIGFRGLDDLRTRIRDLSVELTTGEKIHPLRLHLRIIEKCRTMAMSHYVSAEEDYALDLWEDLCEMMLEDPLGCDQHVELIAKVARGEDWLARAHPKERNWNEFERIWCDLDPRRGRGLAIKLRDIYQPQLEIMNLEPMDARPVRGDAREEVIRQMQTSEAYEVLHETLWLTWERLSSAYAICTATITDPYASDPTPWVDIIINPKHLLELERLYQDQDLQKRKQEAESREWNPTSWLG